jgi:hypothetical protein
VKASGRACVGKMIATAEMSQRHRRTDYGCREVGCTADDELE